MTAHATHANPYAAATGLPAPAADSVQTLLAQAEQTGADNPAAAFALARQAAAHARADQSSALHAQALLAQATWGARAGLPAADQADLLRRAAGLCDAAGDQVLAAVAHNRLGNLYARQGQAALALAAYESSLTLRRHAGDHAGEAATLGNLGALLREQGQLADALAHVLHARALANAACPGDARAHGYLAAQLGAVLAALGDEPERALSELRQALALAQQAGDTALAAAARTHLGRLLASSGDTDEAERQLRAAQALLTPHADALALADTQLALAQLHQQRGEHAAAAPLLAAALAAAQASGQPHGQADALLAQARAHWVGGDGAAALRHIDAALDVLGVDAADPLAGPLHALAADIHEAQGRPAQALAHLRAHLASEQRLRGQDTRRRARQQLRRADIEPLHAERDELAQALDEARRADEAQQQLVAQLSEQSDLLRQLAHEDGLTGLANRRRLDEQLARERERARRYGHPLALALVDIDHFKRVNDQFGHPVGDAVLRRVGALLRERCRSVDVVGRYGGEEFMVVLVETGLPAALGVCQALRERVAALTLSDLHPELAGVTVSMGVAAVDPAADGASDPVRTDLVGQADAALYAAKRGGRNRVVAADDLGADDTAWGTLA